MTERSPPVRRATGAVSIEGPVGSFPYADTIHISGQFFLVPPDTAP